MLLTSPCRFLNLDLGNRIARSATAERAAGPDGRVAADYAKILGNAAAGGAGLLITGHAFIEPSGANSPSMTGIHDDAVIPGLKKAVDAVHQAGAKIFMQISHCGRQTTYSPDGSPPPAPSVVPAPKSLVPREMTGEEAACTVAAFVRAARRVKAAGFDGVELHGAHGYLISQFSSPYTNRRSDEWGGSYEGRFRFVGEIIRGIKSGLPGFPLLIKWNSEDFVEGGLSQEESCRMVFDMQALGLDGVEISGGIFESPGKTCRRHVKSPEDEGYFSEAARRLRKNGLKIPVLLVGGFRTPSIMEQHLQDGVADLISLCRPLVRDPYFPSKITKDSSVRSDCISCNACLVSREVPTRCRRQG